MNVNPNLSSSLMEFFVELDAERQGKLLSYAYKLTVEQTVEKELCDKLHRDPHQREIEDALNKRLARIAGFASKFNDMDETGKATVVMAIEKMHPTSVSVTDEVTITTTHRPARLDQSLKEAMPNADITAARRAVSKCFEDK